MRVICLFILLVLAIRLPAADAPAPMMDGAWSIGSELLNPVSVQFMSRITREQLARTPVWKEDSEFPPLSPRKAADLAQPLLRKLAGGRRWGQPDISLKPFDVTADEGNHREVRWLYVLHFGLLSDMDNNQAGAFNLIVLMDGTVLEPRLVVPKPAVPKLPTTNAPPAKAAPPR
jgi:hypothetical protein